MVHEKIESYRFSNREPAVWEYRRKGYTLFRKYDRKPVARLRITEKEDIVEVLWWSHRDRWETIGGFGSFFLQIDEALDYIHMDPMECFW